jgi:hypothetical protein
LWRGASLIKLTANTRGDKQNIKWELLCVNIKLFARYGQGLFGQKSALLIERLWRDARGVMSNGESVFGRPLPFNQCSLLARNCRSSEFIEKLKITLLTQAVIAADTKLNLKHAQ